MKALLLLLPFALAACTAPDSTAPTSPPADTTTKAPTASTTTLSRHHWQLHDAVDPGHQRLDGLFSDQSKPLQLDFTSDQIRVTHACNTISGSYHIVDGHLDSGPLLQTMMACPDPVLMERESTIKELLQGKPTLILSGTDAAPLLVLAAASGQTLTFAGQPTAETRYGGPGETVFLEVAPQSVPCEHPLIPDTTCLQVRERHYGANGVAVDEPGPWQPLQQEIDGYAHEPGIRNVLRLKRYTLQNPPADAPPTAYVLDMVVESEVVKTEPQAQP